MRRVSALRQSAVTSLSPSLSRGPTPGRPSRQSRTTSSPARRRTCTRGGCGSSNRCRWEEPTRSTVTCSRPKRCAVPATQLRSDGRCVALVDDHSVGGHRKPSPHLAHWYVHLSVASPGTRAIPISEMERPSQWGQRSGCGLPPPGVAIDMATHPHGTAVADTARWFRARASNARWRQPASQLGRPPRKRQA